ncbi:MAG TPA: hypothetical protein VFL80_12965 [Thermoanaerobaculia bacterium]|nr:hypothetical protein [Thermoanaerobaculia bacterium]
MKTHYSEADLLETYYLKPGESMPVMMHLASCGECAARYERLERKLRETSCHSDQRPDTFWTRQRLSIMRRIARDGRRPAILGRTARIAAAAALAFFMGGAVVFKVLEPALDAPPAVITTAQNETPSPLADEAAIPSDPWQSDELDEFRPVVEWESWIDSQSGGKS